MSTIVPNHDLKLVSLSMSEISESTKRTWQIEVSLILPYLRFMLSLYIQRVKTEHKEKSQLRALVCRHFAMLRTQFFRKASGNDEKRGKLLMSTKLEHAALLQK